MKKARLFVMMLGAALAAGQAGALEKAPYKCDFGNEIVTSNHAFRVASNWSHIVDSHEVEDDWWPETYWVSYTYRTTEGVDGTPYLYVGSQNIGSYSDTKDAKDILVTPLVKGDVKIMVRKELASYNNFIDVSARSSRQSAEPISTT